MVHVSVGARHIWLTIGIYTPNIELKWRRPLCHVVKRPHPIVTLSHMIRDSRVESIRIEGSVNKEVWEPSLHI